MEAYRALVLYLVSAVFVLGGIGHFVATEGFAVIVPGFLPWPHAIVLLTGVLEFALAAALLWPRTRYRAGQLAAIYCLAVLPANINQALNDLPMFGVQADPWLLWARIPMQFVLIAAILWASRSPDSSAVAD